MDDEKKIYIGNIDYEVTEEDLREIFKEKGFEAKDVNVIKDKFSGRSKGFGFAEFENDEQVQKAIESLDGYELKSRKLKVNKAQRRESQFENRGGFKQFNR
ncbi:MAG TPA: RNA-binding protein [bacterium]|nr:RNA-binding protein [bacterium]